MELQVFYRALGLSLVGGLSTALGTAPPDSLGSAVAEFPLACLPPCCGSLPLGFGY